MKMKAIWHAAEVKLFVALVLAASVFAAGAHAETRFRGRFRLANEVHWGKAVLPAGDYSISMGSGRSPALVQSNDGKTSVFTPTPIGDDGNNGNKGPSVLIIAARGNEREVLALNLPTLGSSFVYKRLTKAEREMIADVEQVQVAPAKATRN